MAPQKLQPSKNRVNIDKYKYIGFLGSNTMGYLKLVPIG